MVTSPRGSSCDSNPCCVCLLGTSSWNENSKLQSRKRFLFFFLKHILIVVGNLKIKVFFLVSLDVFTWWEQEKMKDFKNIYGILKTAKDLCITHPIKAEAGEAMAGYAAEILDLDFSQTSALESWKVVSSQGEIPEYCREDDENGEEETMEVGEEPEEDAGAPEDSVMIVFSTSAAAKELSCTLFGPSFQCEGFVLPVSTIINKRTCAKAKSSSVWIPLTSRAVERMFSEWRRKTDEASEIRATSMQIRLFLKLFSYWELLDILQRTPLTPGITSFLNTLQSRDLGRRAMDKAVFEVVLAQTQQIHSKARVAKQLGIIRTELEITPPVKRLWTKAHSLESIEKMGICLSARDKRTKTAACLQEMMMSTFTGRYPKLSLPSYHTSKPSNPKAITMLGSEENRESSGERGVKEEEGETGGDVVRVEKILKHEKRKSVGKGKGEFDFYYWTQWENVKKPTWQAESTFGVGGFCLSEYWQEKVAGQKKIRTASSKDEKVGVDDDGEGVVMCFDVEEIVDSRWEDEVLYLCVKWKNYGELTWEPQTNFDSQEDLVIANYWKKKFFSKKSKK
jgi:hypothetical protein